MRVDKSPFVTKAWHTLVINGVAYVEIGRRYVHLRPIYSFYLPDPADRAIYVALLMRLNPNLRCTRSGVCKLARFVEGFLDLEKLLVEAELVRVRGLAKRIPLDEVLRTALELDGVKPSFAVFLFGMMKTRYNLLLTKGKTYVAISGERDAEAVSVLDDGDVWPLGPSAAMWLCHMANCWGAGRAPDALRHVSALRALALIIE